jgi:AraC-like DNA-binding protein
MLHLILIACALLILVLVLLLVCKSFKKMKQRKMLQQQDTHTLINGKINQKQLDYIVAKLDLKLKTEKIYTNPDLSIQDLAAEIGTNRSYISSTINTFYNRNFCSYINHYRFQELADTLLKDNDYSHKELATKCGFGSIDSMKRTVKLKTGLSMKEWKDFLTNEDQRSVSDN